MGITGLLPNLKDITKVKYIRELRGKTCALDCSMLLHRKAAMQTNPKKFVLNQDNTLIADCMEQIRHIRRHGVEPLVVFDGDQLPLKAREEEDRNRKREESYAKALEAEAAGDTEGAHKAWRAALAIKPYHAKQLIEALKAEPKPIQFIVAPYEADAQLAYLARTGRVDAVITEDSDLLVYGCPKVLFKPDFFSGTAHFISLKDLPKNRKLKFTDWDHDLFTEMCVLSGCDFLPNIHKRAIISVHRGLSEHKCGMAYINWVRSIPGTRVPPNYELDFLRAKATFRHQVVFCPDSQACVHLTPLPPGGLSIFPDLVAPSSSGSSPPSNGTDSQSSERSSRGVGGGIKSTEVVIIDSRGDRSSSVRAHADHVSSGASTHERSIVAHGVTASSSGCDQGSGDVSDQRGICVTSRSVIEGGSDHGLSDGSADASTSENSFEEEAAWAMDFLGSIWPPEIAVAVALGEIDARTKKPFTPSILYPSSAPPNQAHNLKTGKGSHHVVTTYTSSSSSSKGVHAASSDSRTPARRSQRSASFWGATPGAFVSNIARTRSGSRPFRHPILPREAPQTLLNTHNQQRQASTDSNSSANSVARPWLLLHGLAKHAPMLIRWMLV